LNNRWTIVGPSLKWGEAEDYFVKLKLDYGSDGLEVDLPSAHTTVIEPVDQPAVSDRGEALVRAMREPMGRGPLHTLVGRSRKIGISVCDITRAQPRQLMLEALFSEMPWVRMEDATVFIATGTHRANTPEEIEAMLGPEIAKRCRILCHYARDDDSIVNVGKTSTGVPIWLNKEWVDCDFKITTGFVEPHFFAGFSGGPKMVAPGLAGLETVMHLHDAARIGHPSAIWGVTEGNPIHDDVREISRMTGVDFAVDVTLNRHQEITAVFAGDLLIEHAAACASAKANAMRAIDEPFDVVVTTNSGYPLDQNLYQAVKGMSAAATIVKPGGTIICAAECRDGLPDHGAYGEVLRSQPSPKALLDMITAPGYSRPDQWQVQIQAQIQLKAKVIVKCDGLDDDAVRAAHFEPTDNVTTATARALESAGPNATLCVLPQGPQTIPYLS
jgi:nickel-dependent lactate racemase